LETNDAAEATWSVPSVACPTGTVIAVLANKWVLYALGALRQNAGPMRFNELSRSVPGVTQKMLTQTLRTLERDGLVVRKVFPTVPPRVEYDLTPLGCQAGLLSASIGQWADTHVGQILDARLAFDARTATAPGPVG
jgi:DNA-binding HxlR family transcriptional regulator